MTRWWTDASAAAEKLELVDSSNPSMGMGVAVLGFHAVAKSALDPLARTTLHDQASLSRAYDEADFSPVVDAVHSALCGVMDHDAAMNYGRLVVSDWVSTSKDATTRLTTTLVNKGQPWPRAIARAAEVAGVPLRHLGRYASSAASPGLDPLSVADMADRALFEYAGRRAAMESDLVGKSSGGHARTRTRAQIDEPWDESEVVRDELGRFAPEARAAKEAADQVAQMRAMRELRRSRVATAVTEKAPGPKGLSSSGPKGLTRAAGPKGLARTSEKPQREPAAERTNEEPIPVVDMDWLPRVSIDKVPPTDEGGYMTVDESLFILQTAIPGDESSNDGLWGLAFRGQDIDRVLAEVVEDPGVDFVVIHNVQPGDLIIKGYQTSSAVSGVKGYAFPMPGVEEIPDPQTGQQSYVDLEISAPLSRVDAGKPPVGWGSPGVGGYDMYVDIDRPASPRQKAEAQVPLAIASEPRSVQDPTVLEATNAYRVFDAPTGRGSIPVYYKRSKMITFSDADLMSKAARSRTRAQTHTDEPWDESEVVRDAQGRFAVESKAMAEVAQMRAARQARAARSQSVAAPAQAQGPKGLTSAGPKGLTRTSTPKGLVRTQPAARVAKPKAEAATVADTSGQTRTLAAWAGNNIDRDTKVVTFNRGVIESRGLNVWDKLTAGQSVSLTQALLDSQEKVRENVRVNGMMAGQLSHMYPKAPHEDAVVLAAIYSFAQAAYAASGRLSASSEGLSISREWEPASTADDTVSNIMLKGQNLIRFVDKPVAGAGTKMVELMMTRGSGAPEIEWVPVRESMTYEPQLMLMADPEAMTVIQDLYFMTTPLLLDIGDQKHSEDYKRGQRLLETYGEDRGLQMEHHNRSNQLGIVLDYLADNPLFLDRVPDMVKEAVAYDAMTTAGVGAVRLDGVDIVRVSSKEPL